MTTPLLVEDTNLSKAWIKVLDHIIKNSGKEITPLMLSVTKFDEEMEFRDLLNSSLSNSKMDSIETVSETIFPNSLYQYFNNDRNSLYKEYNKILPRIKKIDSRNSKGTYFERLIAYGDKTEKVNQLEIIITSLQNTNVKRRSKLQASLFDPNTDHTDGMFQGFPCLQHVTFYKTKTGLILNSFYAVQYLYQRAYGNWLGLINLGKFIANELNIEFERFNCYVGVEQLDPNFSKLNAKNFLKKPIAKKLLNEINKNN